MNVLVLITLMTSFACGAEPCPESARAEGLGAFASKAQTEVRAQAGDPCPDKHAVGTDAEQTELLELIRFRLGFHIQRMIAKTRKPDEADLRSKFLQMRVFLALRHCDVRLKRGALTVVPELKSKHDGDFADLARFAPEDLARMNALIGARVARANELFAGGDARAGSRLMSDLRQMGSEGYLELVSNDPTLRYVKDDLDVRAAAKALRDTLEKGRDELPDLSLNPPMGRGVGLVYATDVAAGAVKQRPELCGAFNSLVAKARRIRRDFDTLDNVSMICPMCSLVTTAAALSNTYVLGSDFKRIRLLYGTPAAPIPKTPGAVAEGR